MDRRLVEGPPRKSLWIYSLPLLFSVVFQQLYNIADSIIAGRFIGENALAAVGNASEITHLYTAVAIGSNIGCSVVVSQLFGGKKYKDVKTAITTAFCSFGVVCFFLVLFGYIFTPSILEAIKTPLEIYSESWLYLKIYTAGVPFVLFYNVATGIFSALGDSKTPFVFLAFSSLSNIFVDILFVEGFGMNVDGVAWATLLCQGISCVLSLFVLYRKVKAIETDGKTEFFSKSILGKIVSISVPSIMQQSFISVGNVIIQGVINSFGAAVIAGFTAAIKLNNIVTSCFTAIGNGMSTYTAQNIGAGKQERVKQGYKAGLLLQYIVGAFFSLSFVFSGRFLVKSFMDSPTDDAVSAGFKFLLIVAPFYVLCATKLVTDGILRGSGAVKYFTIATFADLILRVILSFVLSGYFEETGVWLSWPIGWFVGMAFSLFFYFKGVWKIDRKA
ncbi:MAG: MATE family efflux transporter [Clostridia bacterium]|nr:MATE family efflux transporter [Clostridia bacterium]